MTEKEPDLNRALRIVTGLFVAFIVIMALLVWAVREGDQDKVHKLEDQQAALSALLHDFEQARATARVSSCDQAVDFATAHNDLVRRNQDLLRRVFGESTDPDVQEALAEEIALYDANVVPVRDCSPEGIQSFADGTGGYLP